jgi:hypothetical protein
MDLAKDEPMIVLSKSVSMIERIIDRLDQADESQFPTTSSTHARDLLREALKILRDPAARAPVGPAVLYNQLLSLEELAESVCRSSTDRIFWPLVSYCDDIWTGLFGSDGPGLFYSLTAQHNYRIFLFSDRVKKFLLGVLPRPRIAELLGERKTYCLELPSSEDANLPLYANIGHEFGHAVFDYYYAEEIRTIQEESIRPLLVAINEDLRKQNDVQAEGRMRHVFSILTSLSKEIFCDLVGVRLMGPAFLLSLFEMSWGENNKSAWKILLSPDASSTRAHPSFPFRLDLIKRQVEFEAFCSETVSECVKLNLASIKDISDMPASLPVEHGTDIVSTGPRSDADAKAVEKALQARLPDVKNALDRFANDCDVLVKRWCHAIVPSVDSGTVAHLLHRLENHILPNIVPDQSLLGKCAWFPAILVASGLFRLKLLAAGNSSNSVRETGIVERLTAKALEVTYVHREYKKRFPHAQEE